MKLSDNVRRYPEILVVFPVAIMSIGYFIMKRIDIATGYTLILIGDIFLVLVGYIILYKHFLEKLVERKLTKEERKQYFMSYIAGIYGGMTVIAFNYALLANNLFSLIVWTAILFMVLIVGGLLGLATSAIFSEDESP